MPQERIQEHIVEETDAPVPHVMEKITVLVKHIPQERVLNYTVEQIVAVPVPLIPQKTKQVTQRIPQDRISVCNGKQNIDFSTPQAEEKLFGMIQLILQECISERIGAKLASRIQEELLEVIQLIRKERISERIVEKSIDVPLIAQDQVQACTADDTVDAPDQQIQ